VIPRRDAAVLVALGGALGSVSRWGLGLAVPSPWATLTVNLVGCLAIGLLAGWVFELRPRLRLLVGVGFLGGFTTFSTQLLEGHEMAAGPAAAYAVGTLVGCLTLASLGLRAGRRLR
jgi:CrcB protein